MGRGRKKVQQIQWSIRKQWKWVGLLLWRLDWIWQYDWNAIRIHTVEWNSGIRQTGIDLVNDSLNKNKALEENSSASLTPKIKLYAVHDHPFKSR